MKIGLIGFGKTGKAVAQVILENKDFCLQWIYRRSSLLENRRAAEFLGLSSKDPGHIYSSTNTCISELLDQEAVNIIIDFSSETAIDTYGAAAAARSITIITAVSHYDQQKRMLLEKLSKKTIVFWSPNITLGVNYLLFAAKFLKKIAPWADVQIIEEHFKEKVGISGTAIKIAESLELEPSHINSVRAGGIVGTHEIVFGFPYQTVRLIHESISREAFGNGVLFVAENLFKKKNGLYHFEDILLPYFAAE